MSSWLAHLTWSHATALLLAIGLLITWIFAVRQGSKKPLRGATPWTDPRSSLEQFKRIQNRN